MQSSPNMSVRGTIHPALSLTNFLSPLVGEHFSHHYLRRSCFDSPNTLSTRSFASRTFSFLKDSCGLGFAQVTTRPPPPSGSSPTKGFLPFLFSQILPVPFSLFVQYPLRSFPPLGKALEIRSIVPAFYRSFYEFCPFSPVRAF